MPGSVVFTDTVGGIYSIDEIVGGEVKAALFDEDLGVYDGNAIGPAYGSAPFDANECADAGYTAGGQVVGSLARAVAGGASVMTGDNVLWAGSGITGRYVLLYNTSDGSAVRVIDLGFSYVSGAAGFAVNFAGGVILTQSP